MIRQDKSGHAVKLGPFVRLHATGASLGRLGLRCYQMARHQKQNTTRPHTQHTQILVSHKFHTRGSHKAESIMDANFIYIMYFLHISNTTNRQKPLLQTCIISLPRVVYLYPKQKLTFPSLLHTHNSQYRTPFQLDSYVAF